MLAIASCLSAGLLPMVNLFLILLLVCASGRRANHPAGYAYVDAHQRSTLRLIRPLRCDHHYQLRYGADYTAYRAATLSWFLSG